MLTARRGNYELVYSNKQPGINIRIRSNLTEAIFILLGIFDYANATRGSNPERVIVATRDKGNSRARASRFGEFLSQTKITNRFCQFVASILKIKRGRIKASESNKLFANNLSFELIRYNKSPFTCSPAK